jgi:N12 class adenine-specific DNA methylase
MWDLARGLGFERGRVLEPGCGAGVFIGLAPEGAEVTGVELDDTTAAIAQALYPDARIHARSFAAGTRTPDGSFDLAIGNVPFGDVRLHDPEHNRGNHSIHNHFIIKSLALTRPGGLVIVLNSHYTLDASNLAARREISELADLLGAVRLPTGAHRRAAGTDALTDLLVFRRRQAGAEPLSTSWLRTSEVLLPGGTARVNQYFLEHPDRLLGELSVGHGMHGAENLHVVGERGATAVARAIADHGREIARLHPPQSTADTQDVRSIETVPMRPLEAPEGLWDGHLLLLPSGTFAEVRGGIQERIETPRSIGAELRQLLGLRDGARALLAAEAHTLEDTPAIDGLRRRLREDYQTYLVRYGAINRFTLRRTGRANPQTGEERMARITPPAIRVLRGDPFSALVHSLEVFDESAQHPTPAGLLTQRVIAPRMPVLGVETAQDALAVCLDTRGHVDLPEIARLLGVTETDALRHLDDLVYTDPLDGRLVPAAEYLSGNVREKLEQARASAAADPELGVNVSALERVLPRDLGADEVQARLGAAWIDVDAHRAFFAEILEDDSVRVEHPGGAVWAIRASNSSVLARSEWGTSRMPAAQVAKAVLEQRPVQVTDELDDGRRVVNPVETAAAQEKAHAMQERFAEWCWEQPERARQLLKEYNRRFNSIALRDYSGEGERLTLPGLARTFTPLAHQRSAIARMLCEPAVGLFHQVGAGKTAEMIIGASELRRLGMIRRPAVVVPNHMFEQFSREWLQLYPQARILAASSGDLAGEKRRRFVARAASNDWDAVLMTRSAFERTPVSAEIQKRYEEREIEQLRAMLIAARAGDGLTVKRLEKMVLSREQQLAKKLDGEKDPGICFEETGIDYLVVDEAHGYKNLTTVSNIRDAAIDGSMRASDMHMKTEYLRERHGERVITMATATPIANSVTEAHVMLRYLRPDLLTQAGVEHFDAWAATFGQTVTEIEMAPTGGGNYRMHTRFARFQNVPEMLRMWHVFADVKTAEDLDLATPQIAQRPDGHRAAQTVVIPAGAEIRAYLAELGHRAEQVRGRAVSPEEDNMLKISTDGRKAALDMRLASGQPVAGASKLDVAAQNIAEIWRSTRELTYADPVGGERSATPGALQIVFCDLGTPTATSCWNAYDELREQLAARGVPAGGVRFIHEARNDAEKGRLFAVARAGHVAVLIGSTEKMGVGTNIQARAIALHHLDCPWRPADIEQREGRILRQGNQNPEIGLYRYVVEGSFDAYSWQTVERKAKFISQIIRGRLDVRAIEDIGDNALSFAEVKALASGDPLILEHAQATAELTRLQRLERAWQRNQQNLRYTITSSTERKHARGQEIEAIAGGLQSRVDTRADRFAITINGTATRERKHAGELLTQWATGARPGKTEPLGELGGLEVLGVIRADYTHGTREAVVALAGLPSEPARATLNHLRDNPLTLIRQLEHRLGDLETLQARLRAAQHDAAVEAQRGREAVAQPFKHARELAAARERARDITEQMRNRETHDEQAPDPAPTPSTRDTSPPGPKPPALSPPRPSPTPLSPSRPEAEEAVHARRRAWNAEAGRGRAPAGSSRHPRSTPATAWQDQRRISASEPVSSARDSSDRL